MTASWPAYDLPSTLPAGVDGTGLVTAMGRDKKATGGGLTFVLDGPAGLEVVAGVGRRCPGRLGELDQPSAPVTRPQGGR